MMLKMQISMLVALTVLFACIGVQASEDTVTLVRNNEVVKGRIKRESIEAIEIELSGRGAVTYKPVEVAEMVWDTSEPAEFREGYTFFLRGEYGRAAEAFGGILKDSELLGAFRAEAKAYLNYLYAESLYRGEKTKEAVQAFDKFTADFPTSTYTTPAVSSMVDCAIMNSEFDKVPALLGKLRQQSGEQKALADYLEGKLLLAQKKTKEAEAAFGRAIAGSSVTTTRGMALMGQASCSVQNNDSAKARDLALKALNENPPRQVAAAANVVVGDAILAEIAAKPPAGEDRVNAYLDAINAYSRVYLLYGGDRNTEPKALFKAGEVYDRLSKLPGRGGMDHQRALFVFTKLLDNPRYRGHEYTIKAAEVMKSFK